MEVQETPPSGRMDNRLQLTASSEISRQPLSMIYLVAINSVVAGLEIAVCVAFTLIPTLLLKSGFSETEMSIVLGVAPFIALFTVPGLGRWSDNCASLLGRRRPFILGMSVLLVFSLLLLYFGQSISVAGESSALKGFILAIGVILLDYSSQAAINPCEALVSDIVAQNLADTFPGEEFGFTVYSGMLSVGSCIGYLLIAIDWQSIGISLGNKEQTSFLMCLILYCASLGVTLISAKEKPFVRPTVKKSNHETCSDLGYASEDEESQLLHHHHLAIGTGSPSKECAVALRMPLSVVGQASAANLTLRLRRRCTPWRLITAGGNIIKQVLYLPVTYYTMVCSAPTLLRNLYLADLASWVGIMAQAMFYTDFVAVVVYGGKPDAPAGSMYDLLFDEGVRMGSWGLLLHSLTAAVYAVFIQQHVTNHLGMKASYKLGIGVHATAMAVTVACPTSLICVNVAAAVSGVGYAVVTTIPNTLVTMYHDDSITFYGTRSCGGVGEAIAILDSGFYLSQICLSLVMGHVVELTGLPHYYLIASSLAGITAYLLANKVVFHIKDLDRIKFCQKI